MDDEENAMVRGTDEVRPPTAAKHYSGGFLSLSSAFGDQYWSKCRVWNSQ
jgi:hypothetical protein